MIDRTHGRQSSWFVGLVVVFLASCAVTPEDSVESGSVKSRGVSGIPSEIMWNAAVAPPDRAFVLDGSLDEWSDADRLDVEPGMEVAGHALLGYHDAANGKYHFAIVASGIIGPGTTFWLNTDRDTSTGYQVWGSGVGAEFNVNVAADGSLHLYTGAAGELWVAGPISHAYNGDSSVLEFELSEGMISANEPIHMWVDINNSVFLPDDYSKGGYVIDAVGVPTPPDAPHGAVKLDGELDDWNASDRLDRMPGTAVLGYELYGRADADNYYFALRALPPAVGFGPGTTLWLNTDRNRDTGYQVWGIAVGAEFNINLASDSKPHLYTGAAAEQWRVGPLPFGRSEDGNVMEIAVARTLLDPGTASIDVSVDVNNTIFVPADFTGPGYTLFHPDDLPAASGNDEVRIAMIYSKTSNEMYFGNKAFSQLYAAMQHQAMQAGIPFTLLHEDALTDINQIKDYDVLFIPYMAYVAPEKLQVIEDTLVKAVYHYGIGLITAGNFLTNEPNGAALPGDSYVRMKHLFGVTLEAFFGPADFSLQAGADHPIVRTYAPGETLAEYTAGYAQYYKRYDSVAWPLASVVSTSEKHPAAWAIDTGARSVHFASTAVMGDTELAWRAILWSIYGDRPWVGLQPSREKGLFIARCDMDQSKYIEEVQPLYSQLLPVMQQWKDNFNFVGSYYVNIGNDYKNDEYTDWSVSGPIYKQIIAMGNELGTHSYTHPDHTSLLSPEELAFEFEVSRDIIAQHVGVPVLGAAVPGNPESLEVDEALNKWFPYASADYSNFLAGYHGAMGKLSPDFSMIYLAPNMYFDFTLIGFWKLTAVESLSIWKQQLDNLTAHAPAPFLVWPWHDYGPTSWEGPQYTAEMYNGILAYAYDAGVEFVTGLDASRRAAGYTKNTLSVNQMDADTFRIEVQAGAEAGRQALRLELADGRHIVSVDGWPAFAGDKILTGEGARSYTVRLSSEPVAVAHLSSLPMRASLKQVNPEEHGLYFSFEGVGEVKVALPESLSGVTLDCDATKAFAVGELTLHFAAEGLHSCHLSWLP